MFRQDQGSAEEFEAQLSKYSEEVATLSCYSVNGYALVSEFSVGIKIEMEQSRFEQFVRSRAHIKEDSIPLIIRSRKDGDFVHDMMGL